MTTFWIPLCFRSESVLGVAGIVNAPGAGIADATYIRVAMGRDHHDAAPQRGSFKGDQEGDSPEVVRRVSRQQ